MREIKFRGIRIKTGQWVYGSLIQYENGDNPDIVSVISSGAKVSYEVNPETVGQCIGSKDKNGKEIYEGDITQYGYVIMYNLSKALFAEHNERGSVMSYPIDQSQIEIIGNIHNPPSTST